MAVRLSSEIVVFVFMYESVRLPPLYVGGTVNCSAPMHSVLVVMPVWARPTNWSAHVDKMPAMASVTAMRITDAISGDMPFISITNCSLPVGSSLSYHLIGGI